ADAWTSGTAVDAISGKALYEGYGAYLEPGTGYDAAVYVENEIRNVKWEDVGIYAIPEENAIVLCLDKAYSFLKEDGSLSVWAPYYFSSLPVVHKAKYEASKIAPADGATLWTSNYNSSLETTASWGPYKLAEFEAGSHYKLVKNENWYGWNMEQYKNQYNITAINCRKVEEFSTKWMGFLNGSYDDASLQTENVAEYLDSKYVYFTSTSTGTFGMQLYSNLDKLKASENNNGILAIQEFRHAFNLALNRSDIVEKIWPGSSVPCFGLLNVAYYYDIENSPELEDGGQYRNALIAKEGILRAYGFTQGADGKWSGGDLKGLSTEDAYDALTGYNPTLAKQKMQEAIAILTADPEKYGYDATKNITLVYGSSSDTDKQRFRATYLQEVLDDLTKGTILEDKIDVVFDASAGAQWAEAFRTGATQIGFGYGFSGNAFNPFDIIGAFVNPDDSLNYHMYWDTPAIDMTLTMPAGDYAGAGETITMSIQNWYFCLNGLAESEEQEKTYNWGEGFAPVEARLMILSALEEVTIKESRSIMLIADGGGSFLGAKFSYFSEDEHTFMGFGGMRYMDVNYTDEEWTAYVASNNNDLSAEYKKSE
ncbi:MAG: ABC transporter substrate-binding protein, partial [Oscillospiraceae bacterium]|nr:ABC transporter substrate-binding protein [Oscillospiraceae bacterium]